MLETCQGEYTCFETNKQTKSNKTSNKQNQLANHNEWKIKFES